MSPEKQRIALAEACGWKRAPHYDYIAFAEIESEQQQTMWENGGRLLEQRKLPDYLNDLNAMREACNTLSQEQRKEYADQIALIAHRASKDENEQVWAFLNPTAAERAEAFLRTLNKWEDA